MFSSKILCFFILIYVIFPLKGELMYTRAYIKEEILDIFIPLGMKLLKFEREVITSETWGEENMNTYIFKFE